MTTVLYLDSSCAQRGGRAADHTATADVARDLGELRQALGDPQLTYAVYPCGQTFANMIPGNVRAIVIDGVLGPMAWTTTGRVGGSTVPFPD